MRLWPYVHAVILATVSVTAAAGQAATTAANADFRIHEEGDTLPLATTRLLQWDEHEGTWVSLDVAPDGKTIVFELLGDLYTIPIAGGEAKCIVCGLPFDSQPVYSPDGAELAFVSDRDGNENLWVAKADGSEPRQISKEENDCEFISPEWAADGKSIYISHYMPDVNAFEIWRYSADGVNHELERVTHAKSSPDAMKEFNTNALERRRRPTGATYITKAKPASASMTMSAFRCGTSCAAT